MSFSLHVAKVHPVNNYEGTGIGGWDAQEPFSHFLDLFGAGTDSGYGHDDDDFEILRSDLREIVGELTTHGKKYQKVADEVTEILENLEMTEDEMVEALMCIISESDQSNPWILVSWF